MQSHLLRHGENFSEKYSLYGSMLYKIAMIHLGNKNDAEEAVQEAFIKLLYKSPPFNEQEHEKAWLIRVITNICKNMIASIWSRRVIKMEDIAQWETFDSWNNSRQQYANVPVNATLETFLYALNEAIPIEREKVQNTGIYENGEQTQKFILIRLKDQVEVRLRLFKDGYVTYGFTPVFFKVDDETFAEMWNSLK